MIKQLEGHISEQQINLIRDKIINRYKEYLSFIKTANTKKIFSGEYEAHHRKHTLSQAISEAFPDGEIIGDDLLVSSPEYGSGHKRPVLSNDTIVIHILSETSDFKAKYLKEYYLKNSNEYLNKQLYCYFKFCTNRKNRDQIVSISLCLPDKNGTVIEKEKLLNKKAIFQLIE